MTDDVHDEEPDSDVEPENEPTPTEPDEDGETAIELEWGEPGVKRGQ